MSLLCFVSSSPKNLDDSDKHVVMHYEFTRRASALWKERRCDVNISLSALQDTPLVSAYADESMFPISFALDTTSDGCFGVSLILDPENLRIAGMNLLSQQGSHDLCEEKVTLPIQVELFFLEAWDVNPFDDLPHEILLSVFDGMVTSSDYDFTDRGSSRFFQHIQLLRCVCKRFNRLALTTLCRVLGTFVERPGGTTFGSARLAYLPVDPLDIFARYPESFAPYLKRIGLRGVVEPSNRTLRRWKLLLSAFGMCKNLNWIGISVKPPQKRKRKEALLRALGGLTNLNYLQLANKKNHGYSRWDSEDLAFLLRQTVVTKIERLILDGWDLSVFKEGLFDASLTNPRMHLLQIRSCRIGFDVLQHILRFLLPHVDDYPIIPIPSKGRVFRFSSFFPNLGLMTPQSLVPLVLAHTTYIHGLWIELTSHSRQEREHAMPKLPHSIDHSVHGFHELRALSINGEHENSTLISATFLDGLDCPFLWLLQINFCFLNTSSILAFLSTYERYASVRTSNLWMYYTPFWGDVEETAQDWARRLAGLEGETGRFEDWKDGEMGDRVYEGKHFAFCYNEGGFAAEDELSAGFWE